jgi:biotin carboxyl carrier protein
VKILVNGNTYEIEDDILNGPNSGDSDAVQWDLVDLGRGSFHVLRNHGSYEIELIAHDPETKRFVLSVNNSVYELDVKDRYDELLDQLGMKGKAAGVVSEMKAPMPGLVLDIVVEVGQQVAKGDPVIVLEAMKMENVLKAPADLIVSKIEVTQGNPVEKNQVLLRFD